MTPCVLVESDATGKPVRNLPLTGSGMVYDEMWAVDGTHVWMLVETIAGVSRKATLTYGAIADARTDRGALELTGGDGWPHILGITTETDDGHALVAIGDDAGFVRAFVAPDGNVTTQDGSAWFAGWGGDQPAYDPD